GCRLRLALPTCPPAPRRLPRGQCGVFSLPWVSFRQTLLRSEGREHVPRRWSIEPCPVRESRKDLREAQPRHRSTVLPSHRGKVVAVPPGGARRSRFLLAERPELPLSTCGRNAASRQFFVH